MTRCDGVIVASCGATTFSETPAFSTRVRCPSSKWKAFLPQHLTVFRAKVPAYVAFTHHEYVSRQVE